MKKEIVSVFLMITAIGLLRAQEKINNEVTKIGEQKITGIFQSPIMGESNTISGDLKWQNFLVNKGFGKNHTNPNELEIKRIKEELYDLKLKNAKKYKNNSFLSDSKKTGSVIIGTNYQGNPNSGNAPLDNNIAISDAGWIVSVANATLNVYDASGTNTYTNTLTGFLGVSASVNLCDPLVFYDKQADRFIFFSQECSGNPATSQIILGFSKTNNPMNGFWTYGLDGDPPANTTNTRWFDYPKLSISDDELFVTGNLYSQAGQYQESIIYQINKSGGYNGVASLNWGYWNNITGNPFTLLGVSDGYGGSVGSGALFVSNKNVGGTTFLMHKIDDNLTSNPTITSYTINTNSYTVAPAAPQGGINRPLLTGDLRCLSGFYLNGVIHFAFNSKNAGNNYCGLNYNRLTLNTTTLTPISNVSKMFSVAGVDLCYPAIAPFSNNASDKTVMIGFGSVSNTSNPEIRAVICDDAMNFSSAPLVKASVSYADFGQGTTERWGDYTGITRRHNSAQPSVWISGAYADANHQWSTWIAELHSSPVSVEEYGSDIEIKVFPNPVIETFKIQFLLTEQINLDINLVNISGKLVKQMFKGKGFPGKNYFSFNKANLSNGIYFLNIRSSDKVIYNEKIIITD